MHTKKLITILIVILTAVSLSSSFALAGSKQRHRWEGVAIGVGAAILGHAIYQAHKQPPQKAVVYERTGPVYDRDDRRHHDRYDQRHRGGHWEWQSIWVPPTKERVWNPGHYDRHGRWVKGHWMEVITKEGCWTRERVWVAHHRRHGPY